MRLDGPYIVNVNSTMCKKCGEGQTWSVIGPDGLGMGKTFDDETDAWDFAANLNWAYEAGKKATGLQKRIEELENQISEKDAALEIFENTGGYGI